MRYPNCVSLHRQKKGITQEQLAREVDVSLNTIKNVEHGKTNPRVTTAIRISQVIGISVEELFAPKDQFISLKSER
ncbi:helix-turn-helix transcriptional regulator [Natranaerobius thermophilus]|uniref:Transcriptional regulator, XRE family n=1 Tax=Natranaerobius thermophilus (strain ATCC BAA-1301 / DSM 18059 / JW/NM-WN-LF) TaxID=457570 RepID=B2A8N6_NATTJ|nr:helix-turn-helix transcriptional regulator [Natranaerobius thermophilus]ACB86485.1 transcriptional regulator, XRE family [Natranaerobius thermophilus JW/NM-WN-LF]